jgi:hypothetical protein
LSKSQQFKRSGRATPRGKHVQRVIHQLAVATSVEWNMVRMDMLAYYKQIFLSFCDTSFCFFAVQGRAQKVAD